ncbi:MAG: GIY-YIG nuclease family protein [Dehalococcoidia bacterium]|nr:GIY-YIG nuclease family protein [Dehalococcoidia bacterium]
MSNASKTLYVGVTNDLVRRVVGHKNKTGSAFVRKYNVTRLVYYEQADDPSTAIKREEQIKGWLRARKLALIEAVNPAWDDLSKELPF